MTWFQSTVGLEVLNRLGELASKWNTVRYQKSASDLKQFTRIGYHHPQPFLWERFVTIFFSIVWLRLELRQHGDFILQGNSNAYQFRRTYHHFYCSSSLDENPLCFSGCPMLLGLQLEAGRHSWRIGSNILQPGSCSAFWIPCSIIEEYLISFVPAVSSFLGRSRSRMRRRRWWYGDDDVGAFWQKSKVALSSSRVIMPPHPPLFVACLWVQRSWILDHVVFASEWRSGMLTIPKCP